MVSKKSLLLVSCFSALTVAACASNPASNMQDARFWQRENSTSSLYLQGPKAQQMLHVDIATCTTELRELEKLGEIRRAIPANYNTGNSIEKRTASQEELDQWDSPERDGYLYGEHLDYHDFEGCMTYKGWERVEFLPYTEADKARQDYLDRYGKKRRFYGDRENVTSLHPAAQEPAPYEDMNQ